MAATQAITAQQGTLALKGAAAKTAASKAAAGGGSIFAGKGLGLGIGIGAWGPVIIGLAGVAAVYGYVRSRKAENQQASEESQTAGTTAEA